MTKELLAQKFLDKAEFKAICEIDYNDLDELITEYFIGPHPEGKWWENPYECAVYEEWGNSQSHSFTLKKEELKYDWYKEKIEKAFIGKWDGGLSIYLKHLCNEGIIPECELIVSVYW